MFGPEIQPDEIEYDEKDLLGTGTYGKVFKGRCRGQEVAIKIPHKQNLSTLELAMFRQEVRNMSKNSHPYILRLMGACTEVGKLQIITERCATDLERLLADGEFEFHQILRFARDIAKGMLWLHYCNPPTIHRDLKPANILIDFLEQVKISDFGLAQVKLHDIMLDVPRGSLNWMAPEVLMQKPYTEKIDVYSFGVILWQMATKKEPYDDLKDMDTFFKAICINHERPPVHTLPRSLQSLLNYCWAPTPADRYGFYEIVFRLNEIIVDEVIKDSYAAYFWKKRFLLPGHQELQERVRWSEFQFNLADEVNVPITLVLKLRNFIAQKEIVQGNEEQYVSMARFFEFVQWFGAFFHKNRGKEILQEMVALLEAPWFHGCISRETANSRLTARTSRSYFPVRLSSTDPTTHPFSISFPRNAHERLERVSNGMKDMKGNIYKSIFEYVKAYPERMKHACPKADRDLLVYTSIADLTFSGPISPISPIDSPTPLIVPTKPILQLSTNMEPPNEDIVACHESSPPNPHTTNLPIPSHTPSPVDSTQKGSPRQSKSQKDKSSMVKKIVTSRKNG